MLAIFSHQPASCNLEVLRLMGKIRQHNVALGTNKSKVPQEDLVHLTVLIRATIQAQGDTAQCIIV